MKKNSFPTLSRRKSPSQAPVSMCSSRSHSKTRTPSSRLFSPGKKGHGFRGLYPGAKDNVHYRMGGVFPEGVSQPCQFTIDSEDAGVSSHQRLPKIKVEKCDTKASIRKQFKFMLKMALKSEEELHAKPTATTMEAYICDNRHTRKLRDLLRELKDIKENMVAHLTNGIKVLIAEGVLHPAAKGRVYGKKFLRLLLNYAAKHKIEMPEISVDAFCHGMRYVKKC